MTRATVSLRRGINGALIALSLTLSACTTATEQWTAPPCTAASEESTRSVCGSYAVEERYATVSDIDRRRNIPIKIYAPSPTDRAHPTIIFSHGIGNSHDGYRYLGRVWASHGFISVHLNHNGSDKRTLLTRGKLYLVRAFFRRSVWRNRVADVAFIAEQVKRGELEAARGADPSRIALAGHSLGALTVLEAAESKVTYARGVVALAPPAVGIYHRRSRDATVGVPTLFMHGGDETSYSEASAEELDEVADVYEFELDDAVHETFSDDEEEPLPKRARDIAFIQYATIAMWNAYLDGEEPARRWLQRCKRDLDSCVGRVPDNELMLLGRQ